MEMDFGIERAAEALDQGDRAGVSRLAQWFPKPPLHTSVYSSVVLLTDLPHQGSPMVRSGIRHRQCQADRTSIFGRPLRR